VTQSDFKNQVDNLMNILFGAGVASHATIIEQINYLVFLRSLSKKDDNAMKLDSSAEMIFSGELKKYDWNNLLILNADELFISLEEVLKKLPEITTNQTIKLLFRDAHVKIYEKPTLRRLVHEIEKMFSDLERQSSLGHTDIFGDMYEYLLSKLSQAGTLGSFRTPRHIIKFMVDVIDPKKGETILDPACGTAGFLVAALKHLEEKHTSDDYKKEGRFPMNLLTPSERDFVYKHTFTGFDSDAEMFKFGLMNLYLHHLEDPKIIRQNTLVDTAGDRTKWDVILANPPFSGALDKESVSEDLRMNTGATEVLFLRFMLDHLSSSGRVGVVVPEGVLFNVSQAHYKIREMLIDSGLWCIVSLHGDVFRPYAGVKTSILFFDKNLKDKNTSILMLKIKDDGFDHGGTKKPIERNDLPVALKIVKTFSNGNQLTNNDDKIDYIVIDKNKILDNNELSLQQDRYPKISIATNSKWPKIELQEFCKFKKGSFSSTKTPPGIYPLVLTAKERKTANDFDIDGEAVLIPLISSAGHGRASINTVHHQSGKFALANLLAAILPDTKVCSANYLHLVLDSIKDQIAKEKMSGAANVSMKIGQLSDIKVPLPPLKEQEIIVTEIDKYKKIIDGAKQMISKWAPIPEINLLWPIKKIGEVSELNPSKPKFNEWDFEKEVFFLPMSAIDRGSPNPITMERRKLKDVIKGYTYFANDDVLLAKITPCFENGKSGIVKIPEGVGFGSTEFVVIRANKKVVMPLWIWLFIYQNNFIEAGKPQMTGSAGQKRIPVRFVENYEIPVPDLQTQQQQILKIQADFDTINYLKNQVVPEFEEKIKKRIEEVWGE